MRISRPFPLPLWLGLLWFAGPARSQAPAPDAPTGAAAPAPDRSPALPKAAGAEGGARGFADLTHRYRFSEQYTAREGAPGPGLVGAYRVKAHETLKESAGSAEGPPRARQFEYTERPVEVSGIGSVTATVRGYEQFASRPEDAQAAGSPLLEGLTVWYRPRRDGLPQLISLSARRLREREFELVAHQTFVPGLTSLLPNTALRIGDTWRAPNKAIQALLGEPEVRGDSLVVKFVELRRPTGGGATTQAVFSLAGRIPTAVAETLVNAELLFTFAPAAADRPGEPARKSAEDDSLIDARGAITGLKMTCVARGALPESAKEAARAFRVERQLILERKLGGTGPVVREALTAAPAANVANSWLTYTDPRGRFSFQHPQELLPPSADQLPSGANSSSVYLTKGGPDGRDLIQIEVFNDRREPQALKDILKAKWEQSKAEVLTGGEEWLPALDWPGMKVFRVEAALKPSQRGPRTTRIHFDAYLIQLGDKSSIMAIATTTRIAVPSYRREVEQMLKTIRLGSNG